MSATERVIHKQVIGELAPDRAGAVALVKMNCLATMLTVQKQNGTWMVWYETPAYFECNVMVKRKLHVIPTGGSLPRGRHRYLCTTQDGAYVWHWYEGEAISLGVDD